MPSDPLSRDNDYKFAPAPAQAVLDRDAWNGVVGDVALRLSELEAKRTELQDVIDDLRLFGLERLDTAIVPLIEEQQATLTQLASDTDDQIATINGLVSQFQGQTQQALEDLNASVDQALADANQNIDDTIATITANVEAVQQQVDTILAGGLPAENVAEDESHVFVTPGQKAEIGQLRADYNALLGGAPEALDTLNELAAALGDDENFAAGVTSSLAQKQATSEKGQANGYAGLDDNGKVESSQLSPFGDWNLIIEERQASGTEGAYDPSTGWNTVIFNTVTRESGVSADLASNQITINDAGTYLFEWRVPFNRSGPSQTRLYLTDTSTVVGIGTPVFAINSPYTAYPLKSLGCIVVTVSAGQTFEVQGAGTPYQNAPPANRGEPEIYSQLFVRKL